MVEDATRQQREDEYEHHRAEMKQYQRLQLMERDHAYLQARKDQLLRRTAYGTLSPKFARTRVPMTRATTPTSSRPASAPPASVAHVHAADRPVSAPPDAPLNVQAADEALPAIAFVSANTGHGTAQPDASDDDEPVVSIQYSSISVASVSALSASAVSAKSSTVSKSDQAQRRSSLFGPPQPSPTLHSPPHLSVWGLLSCFALGLRGSCRNLHRFGAMRSRICVLRLFC